MKKALLSCFLVLSTAIPLAAAPRHVEIDANGIFLVDGKPFFPLGIWVYDLMPSTLDDVRFHKFNLVVGNGFNFDQLDLIQNAGMMALPFATRDFLQVGINHPALFAWYVTDEPEGHGLSPQQVKASYDQLKKQDR